MGGLVRGLSRAGRLPLKRCTEREVAVESSPAGEAAGAGEGAGGSWEGGGEAAEEGRGRREGVGGEVWAGLRRRRGRMA